MLSVLHQLNILAAWQRGADPASWPGWAGGLLKDALGVGTLEFRGPGASVRLAELSLAEDGPGLVAEMLGAHKASRSSLVTSAMATTQGFIGIRKSFHQTGG